jgi:hypothetical protein
MTAPANSPRQYACRGGGILATFAVLIVSAPRLPPWASSSPTTIRISGTYSAKLAWERARCSSTALTAPANSPRQYACRGGGILATFAVLIVSALALLLPDDDQDQRHVLGEVGLGAGAVQQHGIAAVAVQHVGGCPIHAPTRA